MTDPTKQQAATAKTAREVIAEAVRAADELRRSLIENAGLSENPWPGSPHALFKDALTALRALLDAPEGSVERLVEAGERVRVVHEKRDEEDGGPRVCVPECCGCAFNAALAALRASPESVGGAGVSATPCNGSCDIALASRQVGPDGFVPGNARECAEAWEREASRRGDERRTFEVRWERAAEDASRFLRAFNEERDSAKALTAERDALKADLAAARGEVERMRTEIAGDSHACANGTVRPYPSVVCSLCVSRGHAPSPATEAPISERARLVYEGAFRFPDMVADLQGCKEDAEPIMARVYTRMAAAVLAAAERAAQAPAPAEGS